MTSGDSEVPLLTPEEIRALTYAPTETRFTLMLTEGMRERFAALLFRERVTLCDLLWGRILRARAEALLAEALLIEERGAPRRYVTERLDSAANAEWIAGLCERGQVYWGGRKNREGQTAEDVDT